MKCRGRIVKVKAFSLLVNGELYIYHIGSLAEVNYWANLYNKKYPHVLTKAVPITITTERRAR